MNKNLINEVQRIKELSSIQEKKQPLNEGEATELIKDLLKLFEMKCIKTNKNARDILVKYKYIDDIRKKYTDIYSIKN